MRKLLPVLLLAAGCAGESVHPPDYPREYPGPEGTEVQIDPVVYEKIESAELGTHRTRGISKTIEWADISTPVGSTYFGDAVVVDRVFREDGENIFGVRVRLKNTTKKPIQGEYLIRFMTRGGVPRLGYKGSAAGEERWTGFTLEPFGTETVDDFSRVRGADGFRLFLKGAGGSADGSPDDPSPEAKEARRRVREEGAAQP